MFFSSYQYVTYTLLIFLVLCCTKQAINLHACFHFFLCQLANPSIDFMIFSFIQNFTFKFTGTGSFIQ